MGMSPSCHCICPGPPGPGSSSPTVPTGECLRCQNNALPLRFRLDVSGATGRCSAGYNGSFIMHFQGGFNTCRHRCDEIGYNITTIGCPSSAQERYQLSVITVTGPTRYRFECFPNGTFGAFCGTATAWLSDAAIDPDKLNCMVPYTLTSPGTIIYGGQGGGCTDLHTWPTTVTITPVG